MNAPVHPQELSPPCPQDGIERPSLPEPVQRAWGSDYLADVIRDLDIPYIALNPGASFRGLHDSLVNHLGNRKPQMLLCLHEEHAVTMAHGYAKVTQRPMAAFLHSNVGLMHGAAGIFNAWCDRVPVMVFGATGMVDAATRRPWIEWIHTAQDTGALVRDYTKWDAQPVSVGAAAEALYRARLIALTPPCGPVYVNFPNDLQEQRLTEAPALPSRDDFAMPRTGEPSQQDLAQVRQLLGTARRPVLLMGRVSRDPADWARRIALAEAWGIRVLTDLRVGCAFPTDHPLHATPPVLLFGGEGAKVLAQADLILSLDWIDLAGALKAAFKDGAVPATVHVSLDQHAHRGWSMDHQGLPRSTLHCLADPDTFVRLLLAQDAGTSRADMPAMAGRGTSVEAPEAPRDEAMSVSDLGRALRHALTGESPCLTRLPLGWRASDFPFTDPLSYLGYDGGGTIGSGPGMAIGAALALRDHHPDRLPVAVLGDGDFMMGCQAIWTAVRYRIGLLVVICNNHSFYNDEIHQERVAMERGRPVQNKQIGMHIGGPDIDLPAIARAQGAVGIGPVCTGLALSEAVRQAVGLVRLGQVVVIDAHVLPGYDSAIGDALKSLAD